MYKYEAKTQVLIIILGISLINFSIFCEKVENMKPAEELLKIEINRFNLFILNKNC